MADDPRARRDGVTIAPGHSPGKARLWLAGAAAIAGAAVFVLFRSPSPPDRPEPATPPEVAAAAEPTRVRPPARAVRAAEADPNRPASAPAPSPAREPVPGSEALAPPHEEGEEPNVPSGIGLFPPPGTDPVRVGLVVPDDFELPEGFVRHYQVTDDGQDVPPILVVHPDYELLDAAGNPVLRPEGGVVPPELAPPGMPIETVVVPEPLDESAP
jgi:hypothetical protein